MSRFVPSDFNFLTPENPAGSAGEDIDIGDDDDSGDDISTGDDIGTGPETGAGNNIGAASDIGGGNDIGAASGINMPLPATPEQDRSRPRPSLANSPLSGMLVSGAYGSADLSVEIPVHSPQLQFSPIQDDGTADEDDADMQIDTPSAEAIIKTLSSVCNRPRMTESRV